MSGLTPAARRTLLDEYFANRELQDRLGLVRTLSPEQAREQQRLGARQRELLNQYRASLPKIALARCPFSQAIYAPVFDNGGLDGMFWDYYAAQRPYEEPPGHWIALTGAMKFAAAVEDAPFLAIPGPAVPYVVTRLIEHPAVKAVVQALPVGRHTAYAVTYFASAWPDGVTMPNAWGMDFYRIHLAGGQTGWYRTYETPAARDFDLARWLEKKKLYWVTPGDAGMALRDTVADCPYLNLPGCRDDQRVAGGVAESGEPVRKEIQL